MRVIKIMAIVDPFLFVFHSFLQARPTIEINRTRYVWYGRGKSESSKKRYKQCYGA